METLEWPDGVSKPEFMMREYGKTPQPLDCAMPILLNSGLLFSNSFGGLVTSLLIFGNSGFAFALVASSLV